MHWPSVYKLKFEIPDSNPRKINVQVNTQMYCGHPLKLETKKIPPNKEYKEKDRLHDQINNKAAGHIVKCDKCRRYYNSR